MSKEIVPVSENFKATRVLRTTSATTQIRHLGPGGRPGFVVLHMSSAMHLIDVEGDQEPEYLPDSLWTEVRIELATAGDVSKKYLAEFSQVLLFSIAEVERIEAHACKEDAEWKAKGPKK